MGRCKCNDITHAIELPNYLTNAVTGQEMTGIPYCWGGFNGIDAVSSGIYSTSFLNAITRTASIHTRTCTVCGYEDELEHTWSYEQNSATTHIRTCTLCGYRAAARHSNYKTGISATEHVVICGYCRYSVPENHTEISFEKHRSSLR